MSGLGKDHLIDCSATANGGQCQVTFADIKYDDNGNPIPVETVITGADDICTCQCLDYIFVINRNKSKGLDNHMIINSPNLNGNQTMSAEGLLEPEPMDSPLMNSNQAD